MTKQSRPENGNAWTNVLHQPTELAREAFASLRTKCGPYFEEVQNYVIAEPQKALLSAVAVGYVLRVLPVVRIASTLLRIAAALAVPAAVVFGGARVLRKVDRSHNEAT